ncbi:(Fe-S)-binding protein [Rufibacter glacialis]|uniref:(Fe-S)-binding protein n=1 Tax=Rufibacter glacialis TaxID=1259555 RepID=A0A5M8QI74_9BACT|nr:(Fe-S)-binding protein [Rufibacter glacialis]KAA6434801.1 (Fe-S)-binding protein [Rufibacter glacialis]GGK72563.1 glycolate oxidase [Rufibacter glacialis]
MKVGLFIPCYVDQFYPQVAVASLQLLEKLGVEVDYPLQQTCCGQPMANSGFASLATGCDALFARNFAGYDYIVSPSGSCVLHIKDHLQVPGQEAETTHIRNHIYELSEFLTDVLQVKELPARFPHKVGFHLGCHGQRGLQLAQMSELAAPAFSKPGYLLSLVQDLEVVPLSRPDECCGFGGSFCVTEEAVSAKMGQDRVADHQANGAEYIAGADVSCLMHLEGVLRRQKSPLQVIHLAQILNGQVDA